MIRATLFATGCMLALMLLLAPASAQNRPPGNNPPRDNKPPQPPQPPGDARPQMEFPVPHTKGPCNGVLGGVAEVKVPADCIFIEQANVGRFLELTQNPPNPSTLGVVMNLKDDWFVIFTFDPCGYVKDEEKNDLDADAILDSLRKGNEAGNRERQARGWAAMQITGWEQPPKYDEQSRNLTWAIRGQSGPEPIVNFNSRILGREGVMSANLVVEPKLLAATLPKYKNLLGGFNYKAGKRYDEFRAGDKIAEYGLAALIGGGAAAVALKTGLLQKFGKLIIAGIVGICAAIGSVFKKIFGKGKAKPAEG